MCCCVQLVEREQRDRNTDIIVMSDVWLDRENVLKGLKHMLGKYDEVCREGDGLRLLFVMMGNFTSLPAALGYAKHKQVFEHVSYTSSRDLKKEFITPSHGNSTELLNSQ